MTGSPFAPSRIARLGAIALCLGALCAVATACTATRRPAQLGVFYFPSPQPDGSVVLAVIGDSATGYKTIRSDAERDALIDRAANSACSDGYEILAPVTTSLGSGVFDKGLYTRYRVHIRCKPAPEATQAQ